MLGEELGTNSLLKSAFNQSESNDFISKINENQPNQITPSRNSYSKQNFQSERGYKTRSEQNEDEEQKFISLDELLNIE